MLFSQISSRQIGVEKTESVRDLDNTHSSPALLFDDLIAKRLHSRPMHLWAEMMLRVKSVVEPRPVIELAVGAHTPGNGLVGIASIMPIVAVEITKAVAEVPERQEIKNDVAPVEQKHYKERGRERSQLKVAPE